MNNTNVDKAPAALIKIAIPTSEMLTACYMPFLERKGLFIPSAQQRSVGETVFLVLRLGAESSFSAGSASVCWITPTHCSDGRIAGFGLHFDDEHGELAQSVQTILLRNNHHAAERSYTL
jgi:type IV pilus assembly protein PilZ